jgi:hypothetical protein
MVLLGLIGLIIALHRRHIDALLIFAFPVAYAGYLLFAAPVIFGWYTAPIVAVLVIGCLYGLWHMLERFTAEPARERIAALTGIAYIAALISILPLTMRSDKAIQQYIEDGGRKQVGLYLAKVSLPADTIASESLGYIGYYSRRVIYDYPGLCSREVVQYLRTHPQGRKLIPMMQTLRPTYLVLRPSEYRDDNGLNRFPWIDQEYELVRIFRVPDEDRKDIIHPEKNVDFEFDLFRRKGASTRSN